MPDSHCEAQREAQIVTRIVQVHIVRCLPINARDSDETTIYEHLLLRRSDSAEQFPGMWQVVTGRIEAGELPLQTAFREMEEETGIRADALWVLPHIGMFYDAAHNTMNLVPCFAAIVEYSNATVRLSPQEHTEYQWCQREAALQRLVIPSHQEGVRVLEQHILPLLGRGEMPAFARHNHC